MFSGNSTISQFPTAHEVHKFDMLLKNLMKKKFTSTYNR